MLRDLDITAARLGDVTQLMNIDFANSLTIH